MPSALAISEPPSPARRSCRRGNVHSPPTLVGKVTAVLSGLKSQAGLASVIAKADASGALATSNPAQGDGRKHAHPCSRNCRRHSDITQNDDKGDAGKYIQGTHRTSPGKRCRIAVRDDPVFTDCPGWG